MNNPISPAFRTILDNKRTLVPRKFQVGQQVQIVGNRAPKNSYTAFIGSVQLDRYVVRLNIDNKPAVWKVFDEIELQTVNPHDNQ